MVFCDLGYACSFHSTKLLSVYYISHILQYFKYNFVKYCFFLKRPTVLIRVKIVSNFQNIPYQFPSLVESYLGKNELCTDRTNLDHRNLQCYHLYKCTTNNSSTLTTARFRNTLYYEWFVICWFVCCLAVHSRMFANTRVYQRVRTCRLL